MNFIEKTSLLTLTPAQSNILLTLMVSGFLKFSDKPAPASFLQCPGGHCKALVAHDGTSKAFTTEFNSNDQLYHQETINSFLIRTINTGKQELVGRQANTTSEL